MFRKFTRKHLRGGPFLELEAEVKPWALSCEYEFSENFKKNLGYIKSFSKSGFSTKL